MKSKRHAKILELIDQFDIETQEELADRLNQNGFSVTQATISRDIRELKLSKVSGSNGRQKYVAFIKPTMEMTDKYSRVLKRDGSVFRPSNTNKIINQMFHHGKAFLCYDLREVLFQYNHESP